MIWSANDLRYLFGVRALPPRIAWFHWRARRLARRHDDRFSLTSATRPADLALLLRLARGRREVVELGTATAWTATSLALADARRRVLSYDPVKRPERELYLALVDASVRERIEFLQAPGVDGPPPGAAPVELLYVDSSHEKDETIAELRVWAPALAPGALVVLDDYTHTGYPGVREAVAELGLPGAQQGTLYVHEVGS